MAKALLIGIDGYKLNPLTSAVNDALAFQKQLLDLGLVAPADVTLFTSPPQPGGAAADSKPITDWLYDNIYTRGDALDRFIFYYSGHGILAFSNAAQTRSRTALVPGDVVDLKRDGRLLIDFTELTDVLALTGPQEQLYFIDACRDMPYEQQPDVTSLGWTGKPPGAERAQFSVYAVSPLGKALGARGGMGVMTSFLLEALRGEGLGLEYDSGTFQYVVTMRSLCAHAREKVRQALRNEPAWTQKYQLPTPVGRGPEPQPLRTFAKVEPLPFTVHIVPDAAADQTEVKFSAGNYDLPAQYCYPINRNHEAVHLQPQRHLLIATSTLGTPEPSRQPVDVRVTREITVNLPPGPPPTRGAPVPPAPPAPAPVTDSVVLPATVITSEPAVKYAVAPTVGVIEATTLEPQAEILLESLSPPYESWKSAKHLLQTVAPGSYRLQFRLGPDVFSQQEVFLRAAEHVTVEPPAAVTPLLRETVVGTGEAPAWLQVSESIGPMQAGVLTTLLPIIAIKPFDLAKNLFGQFRDLFDPIPATEFQNRPLSVVLAIDGYQWRAPIPAILNGIRCSVTTPDGSPPVELSALPPLPSRAAGGGMGLQRLYRALTVAPPGSFLFTLRSRELGEFTLASAGLPNRVTVVTAVFRPDGTVDLSQNLLKIPGQAYPADESARFTYGRLLRTLQIGQALYRSGELFQSAVGPTAGESAQQSEFAQLLLDALYAKWTDPILGCMAYYAAAEALARKAPGSETFPTDVLKTAAHNLWTYFPDLPDSGVIYAEEFGGPRPIFRDDLLSGRALPLLAESAWRVARQASEIGLRDSPIVGYSRSIVPEQPWLLRRR